MHSIGVYRILFKLHSTWLPTRLQDVQRTQMEWKLYGNSYFKVGIFGVYFIIFQNSQYTFLNPSHRRIIFTTHKKFLAVKNVDLGYPEICKKISSSKLTLVGLKYWFRHSLRIEEICTESESPPISFRVPISCWSKILI